MKRLLLMRHAKSSWSHEALTDHERPLSPRGERDAPRMAERLKERGERPALYLSSSATRARHTAEIVASGLGAPRDAVRVDETLYLAAPPTIFAVVAAQSDACSTLIVFGHNPGMTELANDLCPDLSLDNLPTAGVVALDCDVTRWRELDARSCRLVYLDYPKNSE